MTITRVDGKHVHHDLIVEWAKDPTKQVQVMGPYAETFQDCPDTPQWNPNLSYRFKPKLIKVIYREYLYRYSDSTYYLKTVNLGTSETSIKNMVGFVKWMSDWKTVEIEL